jgi:hypothetical protein
VRKWGGRRVGRGMWKVRLGAKADGIFVNTESG